MEKNDVNVIHNKIATDFDVKGSNITIFKNGEILANDSYGVAHERNGLKTIVTEDTIYRIASISKLVSAMLVMREVDAGNISLDDKLTDLIDPRLFNPDFPNNKPTLRQIMNHTSGIRETKGYWDALREAPYKGLDDILSAESPFITEPGTTYRYSNFGGGLMAAVIEKVTGMRFHEYAKQNLFDPLDIDASFFVEGIKNQKDIAALGSLDPTLSPLQAKEAWESIPLGEMYLQAHGGLYISSNNLARIGTVLAGDGTYKGMRIVSEEGLSLMHKESAKDQDGVARGLGVHINETVPGTMLYGHTGGAYGATTNMFYDLKNEYGIVYLSNNSTIDKVNNRTLNQTVVNEFLDPEKRIDESNHLGMR